MNVETLLALLPDDRRRARLKPRRRGRYRDRQRQRLTPDELLGYLSTNKIRTTTDLRKRREQDPNCPLIHDFIAVFGSWKAAAEQVHGPPVLTQPPPNDPDYIAKIAVQFGAWNQSRYLALRRLRPDVIPSARQVRRVWGGFENLFFAARRMSVKRTLEEYLRIERRMGRLPTALECREAGLDLGPLKSIFGTKWDLDDLLALRHRAGDELQQAS